MTTSKTEDEYIDAAPEAAKKHFREIRALLAKVAPGATEATKWCTGARLFTRRLRMEPSGARRGLTALAACLFLAGCEGASPQNERFITRDSAGVTIVESFVPAWGDERRWSVDPEPFVSIGQEAAEAAYQLHRVTGVARMSDGRIVVANGGSNELRLYSPDGTHLRSVGRSGSGPGEFRYVMGVYRLPGDSPLAYDFLLDRRSLFTAEGDFVRVIEPAQGVEQRHYIESVLPDGSMITASPAEPISHLSLPSGFLRHSYHWIRRGLNMVPLDSLGVFQSDETLNVRGSDFAIYISPPFLRGTHSAVRKADIILGESDSYELRSLAFDGSPLRIIRKQQPARPLRSEEVEQVRSSGPDAHAEDPEVRRIMRDMEFPRNYPAYTMVRADTDDNIWVREYPESPDAPTEEWTVFSPAGEWLGGVELPRIVSVAEIGVDYVLALVRDELDVESVRMYRLSR